MTSCAKGGWLVGAVVVALIVAAPGARARGAPGAQTPPADGDAESGKHLFQAYYCYACHGTMGQGGRDGARLAPNPLPLSSIIRYLRSPSGQMPPYTSKILSDQQLGDIYAYLKSIPAPPASKNIPLLNE